MSDTVKVNGVSATVIDEASGVYFVEKSDLKDSFGGLQRVDVVNFELDGITSSRPIFELTSLDHGVSAGGKYILVGNSTDGWWAHSVSGDGDSTPYSVSEIADTGTLSASLFDATNVIEFDVEDAVGNVNTYSEHFTSDLDEANGQYFAVTSSLHTINSGNNDILRLDIFVSDHALTQVSGVSNFNGSSFDMVIDLPDTIFVSNAAKYSFTTHGDFFYADAEFDTDDDTIVFSAFSESVFVDNDKPILSIDMLVDDITALSGQSGNVTLNIAKMSEVFIPASNDALNLVYQIHLDDLIVTPIEQTL